MCVYIRNDHLPFYFVDLIILSNTPPPTNSSSSYSISRRIALSSSHSHSHYILWVFRCIIILFCSLHHHQPPSLLPHYGKSFCISNFPRTSENDIAASWRQSYKASGKTKSISSCLRIFSIICKRWIRRWTFYAGPIRSVSWEGVLGAGVGSEDWGDIIAPTSTFFVLKSRYKRAKNRGYPSVASLEKSPPATPFVVLAATVGFDGARRQRRSRLHFFSRLETRCFYIYMYICII